MSVQQEVTRALERTQDFKDVPETDPDYRWKTSGLQRDLIDDARPVFVVRDRTYVSGEVAPGDAHSFAQDLCRYVERAQIRSAYAGAVRPSRKRASGFFISRSTT